MTAERSTEQCLTESTVLELIEQRLSSSKIREAEAHIDSCSMCRQLVSALSGLECVAADDSLSAATQVDPELFGLSDAALVPGQLLDERFEIVSVLGRGGAGVVYEAKDLQLGIQVAVKVLDPKLAQSQRMLERLQQEIVLGRRITHPNVCRVHDLGQSGPLRFITMELVQGKDLRVALQEGLQLDPAELLLDICAAVEAAHEKGVVHRDLKPSNIMVDQHGRAKVMDFGLAHDLEKLDEINRVGTPAYWAPEQAQGQPATERADVYALGRIACELYGAPQALKDFEPDRVLAHIPGKLRAPIRKSLKAAPEERFASARDLKVALLEAKRASGWRIGLGLIVALVGLMLVLAMMTQKGSP